MSSAEVEASMTENDFQIPRFPHLLNMEYPVKYSNVPWHGPPTYTYMNNGSSHGKPSYVRVNACILLAIYMSSP
jgi:hypothetical protein